MRPDSRASQFLVELKNETKLSLPLNESLCGKFHFSQTIQLLFPLLIKATEGTESPVNSPKWVVGVVVCY